jgi:hypothetical protein
VTCWLGTEAHHTLLNLVMLSKSFTTCWPAVLSDALQVLICQIEPTKKSYYIEQVFHRIMIRANS